MAMAVRVDVTRGIAAQRRHSTETEEVSGSLSAHTNVAFRAGRPSTPAAALELAMGDGFLRGEVEARDAERMVRSAADAYRARVQAHAEAFTTRCGGLATVILAVGIAFAGSLGILNGAHADVGLVVTGLGLGGGAGVGLYLRFLSKSVHVVGSSSVKGLGSNRECATHLPPPSSNAQCNPIESKDRLTGRPLMEDWLKLIVPATVQVIVAVIDHWPQREQRRARRQGRR